MFQSPASNEGKKVKNLRNFFSGKWKIDVMKFWVYFSSFLSSKNISEDL